MNIRLLIIITAFLLVLSGTFTIFSMILMIYVSGYLLAFELTQIGEKILLIFCVLQMVTMGFISITYFTFKSKMLFFGSLLSLLAFLFLLFEKTFTMFNIGFMILGLILVSAGFSEISHIINSRILDVASFLIVILFPLGEILCGILLIRLRRLIEIHLSLLREIEKQHTEK